MSSIQLQATAIPYFMIFPTTCNISMTAAQTCEVQGTPTPLNPGSWNYVW